ncbi:MAG: ribose-phosphate pyrophosphokinase [bacterium]
MPNPNGFIVLTGNAHPELAKKICEEQDFDFGNCIVGKFSDGETSVKIESNLRTKDVFIIQPICGPSTSVNDHLMELILLIDAAKRSSAEKITAVIPYYGYGRQDRKSEPHVPISAKVVANILESVGANRIITMDLHANQIQGFFNIPVDNLYAKPVLIEYIKESFPEQKIVMVSPDAGGAERARSFAKRLNNAETDIALIDKRRPEANKAEIMNVIGDVKDKLAIIVDDIADTCGTMVKAAFALKEKGAAEVQAVCTHPVLSGRAIERLEKSVLKSIAFADTIPLNKKAMQCSKIHTISVAKILAIAIKRSFEGKSVNSLFT